MNTNSTMRISSSTIVSACVALVFWLCWPVGLYLQLGEKLFIWASGFFVAQALWSLILDWNVSIFDSHRKRLAATIMQYGQVTNEEMAQLRAIIDDTEEIF